MGSASYTKGAKRVGGNHEWTRMARMGNSEPRMDTNGYEWVGMNHEIHEWEIQNHEWTRMDTKGKLRTTNGHEWNHEIQEWNHETHEIHEKRQGG